MMGPMVTKREGIGITLRLDAETVDAIDELVEKLQAGTPQGLKVTRTDALRHAVLVGLKTVLGETRARKR